MGGPIVLSEEQKFALDSDFRLNMVTGGEGSGKSLLGGLTGVGRAVYDVAVGHYDTYLYWIIGADFEDARKEFDYIVGWFDELNLVDRSKSTISTHKDQKCILGLDSQALGVKVAFETVSSHDPLKIAREQPDGIIGCEVSRWERESWNRAYARLSRKRGWGYFSGSYETSEGWFAEVAKSGEGPNEIELRTISLPSWANRRIYPGGYEDPAIQQLRAQSPSEARFMERFGGRPTPPVDSVFPEFKHMMHVSDKAVYDAKYPVYLWVDPGNLVYAILAVQIKGSEVHVIDEVYVTQYTHRQIMNECQTRPWWRNIAPRGHVMDVAGGQHHQGMSSALEAWYEDTGINFEGARRHIDDQVQKVRSVLGINPASGRPYLAINPVCRGLITEFGGGTGPIPGVGRWRNKSGIPEKANNHACQALAYGLMIHFGSKDPRGNVDLDADTDIFGRRAHDSGVSYLGEPGKREKRMSSYLEGIFA